MVIPTAFPSVSSFADRLCASISSVRQGVLMLPTEEAAVDSNSVGTAPVDDYLGNHRTVFVPEAK